MKSYNPCKREPVRPFYVSSWIILIISVLAVFLAGLNFGTGHVVVALFDVVVAAGNFGMSFRREVV